ncbi:hypothetical protein Hanom_Chr01g00072391 [Helianthus anomalus]
MFTIRFQTVKPSKSVIGLVSQIVFYFNFGWSVSNIFQTIVNHSVYVLYRNQPYKTEFDNIY